MLSHPHLLGGDTDEPHKPCAGAAGYIEQKLRESCQQVLASSEESEIVPRVEIMFHRQQKKMLVSAPVTKLSAIGVLFPADRHQQFPIGGTEGDKITAAAMVRPQDKLLRRQPGERTFDVSDAKTRAVPPDSDNFVVTKPRHFLDRVLKPHREIPARLPMNAWPGRAGIVSRRENVNMDIRWHFGCQTRKTEKRPRRSGERTPRQVDVYFVGKNENSSPGHNPFNTKRRWRPTSLFLEPEVSCRDWVDLQLRKYQDRNFRVNSTQVNGNQIFRDFTIS